MKLLALSLAMLAAIPATSISPSPLTSPSTLAFSLLTTTLLTYLPLTSAQDGPQIIGGRKKRRKFGADGFIVDKLGVVADEIHKKHSESNGVMMEAGLPGKA